MYTYEVATTKVVAEGVTRYEGATIEKAEFLDSGSGAFGFITNESDARRTATVLYGEEAADSILHYRFKITSEYLPKWACWDCFGVKIFNTKEIE